ncbi:hypothetical protein, partial [Rhodococcus wratislaviensis]|uniref:hypothetical protein n=1 Tax=Rhodococcus wratislaviensis TaxID=44752 RepID=UPI0036523703
APRTAATKATAATQATGRETDVRRLTSQPSSENKTSAPIDANKRHRRHCDADDPEAFSRHWVPRNAGAHPPARPGCAEFRTRPAVAFGGGRQ